MYQRYDICKMQLSVKLLFIVNGEQLSRTIAAAVDLFLLLLIISC